MKVTQIYEATNQFFKEMLGTETIVNEDLSNIVDLGTQLFNAQSFENYSKALPDHIGRVIFVDRVYRGRYNGILREDWEWGGALEKIDMEMPEAEANQDWQLNDGQSYDDHIFHQPKISVKFYQDRTAWSIPISITEEQVKSAFSSRGQYMAFVAMIGTKIENSITARMEALAKRADNNMIGETLADATTGANTTDVRAINLLTLYKQQFPDATTTAASAITDLEFLRFAAYIIADTSDRMEEMSSQYNVAGSTKFTPKDRQRIVLLSKFARAADMYLQSETFHDEFTRLPEATLVSYWQSGGPNTWANDSSLDITTASGSTIKMSGILGFIADIDAVMIAQLSRKVSSSYTAVADFTNFYHKVFAGYLNDLRENFVVFYIA